MEKEEQIKPKVDRRKVIRKIRTAVVELENRKTVEKITQLVPWEKKIKLISLWPNWSGEKEKA